MAKWFNFFPALLLNVPPFGSSLLFTAEDQAKESQQQSSQTFPSLSKCVPKYRFASFPVPLVIVFANVFLHWNDRVWVC